MTRLCSTLARFAIDRVDAPSNPSAANSCVAAFRMFARVSAERTWRLRTLTSAPASIPASTVGFAFATFSDMV
jgi:hypothetical protein